jgi:hypothetical protein
MKIVKVVFHGKKVVGIGAKPLDSNPAICYRERGMENQIAHHPGILQGGKADKFESIFVPPAPGAPDPLSRFQRLCGKVVARYFETGEPDDLHAAVEAVRAWDEVEGEHVAVSLERRDAAVLATEDQGIRGSVVVGSYSPTGTESSANLVHQVGLEDQGITVEPIEPKGDRVSVNSVLLLGHEDGLSGITAISSRGATETGDQGTRGSGDHGEAS